VNVHNWAPVATEVPQLLLAAKCRGLPGDSRLRYGQVTKKNEHAGIRQSANVLRVLVAPSGDCQTKDLKSDKLNTGSASRSAGAHKANCLRCRLPYRLWSKRQCGCRLAPVGASESHIQRAVDTRPRPSDKYWFTGKIGVTETPE